MSLRLYCNRYGHFKDALVCSVSCVYRTRCHDFALFYDDHRAEVDALVGNYYADRRAQAEAPASPTPRDSALVHIAPVARPEALRKLISLEVLRVMADNLFIWIDKEDRAELLATNEVLRRAERGQKAKNIYQVSREMELRYQLVPRKRIEKARTAAAAEAERTEARRTRRASNSKQAPAPVPFPVPVAPVEEITDAPRAAAPARRTRRRVGR
jgi:hypothetical protein